MKKIIVTGGAGFIGSHLIDLLLKDGFHIINIDNFDPYYDPAIKWKNINNHLTYDTYRLEKIDVRDFESLQNVVPDDVDVIVHLAAKAGVRPSIADPLSYQEVNVAGTQNLLEIARKKSIKQFIFASSSSVYGKNPNVPWKENDAVLQPISPYASTKVSGELLGHVYSHLYDIRFIALRFFTVYGSRQRPDLAIHKFVKLISKGQKITLYGDGTTRRDYTYIDDIVHGINNAIEYTASKYEIINLGNNKTISLSELVKELENSMGCKAVKNYIDEQPGDVTQTWADLTLSQEKLDYRPVVSIKEGLELFYDWYCDNIDNS